MIDASVFQHTTTDHLTHTTLIDFIISFFLWIKLVDLTQCNEWQTATVV